MNDMKSEVDAIFHKAHGNMNELLFAELDKVTAGEHVPFEGSIRKACGYYVKGVDDDAHAAAS